MSFKMHVNIMWRLGATQSWQTDVVLIVAVVEYSSNSVIFHYYNIKKYF